MLDAIYYIISDGRVRASGVIQPIVIFMTSGYVT